MASRLGDNERCYMIERDKPISGTIWLTGISASGKTTLGRALRSALAVHGINDVELLDGEEFRSKLGGVYGYSTVDRCAATMHLAKIAKEYNQRGRIVIVCAISHVKEIREAVRRQLGHFMEVYLRCPVEVCAQRDYKGHYEKAFAGRYDNFVGVTEPYQTSDHPDLVLDTENLSIEDSSDILLDRSLRFLFDGHLSWNSEG